MTPLTNQEIEELRIAIAEEMGWKDVHKSLASNLESVPGERCLIGIPPDGVINRRLPPYTTSIDSIREAAMERFKGDDEQRKFSMALEDISKPANYKWQLTALDWAIAFARTAKIWRWKV
jgi:hypothetical protein